MFPELTSASGIHTLFLVPVDEEANREAALPSGGELLLWYVPLKQHENCDASGGVCSSAVKI